MNFMHDILPYGKFGRSRAINAENPTGEKAREEQQPVTLAQEGREVPAF